MSKSNQPIPPGHAHFIPHLVCDSCAEAIEFYKKAFGAEEFNRMIEPGGTRIMHAALRVGDSFFFVNDDFPEMCGGKPSSPKALQGSPVTIHRYVENCDATIQRAAEAGATVVMPPMDMFWGDRYGVVVDPYGHKWSIATHVRDMTPAEMQGAMQEAFAQARSK